MKHFLGIVLVHAAKCYQLAAEEEGVGELAAQPVPAHRQVGGRDVERADLGRRRVVGGVELLPLLLA